MNQQEYAAEQLALECMGEKLGLIPRHARQFAELVLAACGRLYIEFARDLSDEELERCLSMCVGYSQLMQAVKMARDAGWEIPPCTLSAEDAALCMRVHGELPGWARRQMTVTQFSQDDGSTLLECRDGGCEPGMQVQIDYVRPGGPVLIRMLDDDGKPLEWMRTGLQTADVSHAPELAFVEAGQYCGWIE